MTSGNDQVICTLHEGDYHFGVAVLINSIIRAGFRGLFWVGYRGELPPWTAQLTRREDGLYRVGEALLGFELLDGHFHFNQFKPEFMSSIIRRGIAKKYVWYLDPDITVRCEWEFFERWVRHGVGLCQEITQGTMPSDHPIRCEWMEFARAAGWAQPARQLERYYNSGFVGLDIAHKEFLDTWIAANRLSTAFGVGETRIKHGEASNPFYSTDQDTLNMSAMYAHVPLSTLGPDGMGFVPGSFAMWHSLGEAKPWRRRFLRAALHGNPPWNGDKHFLECADGPIRPYSAAKLKRLRWEARIATFVGRFYSKG